MVPVIGWDYTTRQPPVFRFDNHPECDKSAKFHLKMPIVIEFPKKPCIIYLDVAHPGNSSKLLNCRKHLDIPGLGVGPGQKAPGSERLHGTKRGENIIYDKTGG